MLRWLFRMVPILYASTVQTVCLAIHLAGFRYNAESGSLLNTRQADPRPFHLSIYPSAHYNPADRSPVKGRGAACLALDWRETAPQFKSLNAYALSMINRFAFEGQDV